MRFVRAGKSDAVAANGNGKNKRETLLLFYQLTALVGV